MFMPDATKHILLMDGPDSKGLIYHVTGVLYRHNLNIIHNDEYVSPSGHFFMRTEFEGTFDSDALLTELNSTLPNAEGITFRLNPKRKKNIVVMVTKEHHCLGELLIRYAFDELDADILAVVSNYNVLQPLVSKFGIPFHYVSHEGRSREEHEEAILRTLAIYEPEYLVLAKYMRVLTPDFVNNFPNNPCANANASAPSPLIMTWGDFSMTARATDMACMIFSRYVTEPAFPFSSIMQASSVTRPSRSGNPP